MSLLAGLGGGGAGTAAAPKTQARSGHHWWLVGPGLVYLVLFFVLPVGVMLVTSLYVRQTGAEVGDYTPALHWQNYGVALESFWRQLVRSLGFAGVATLVALAIGYPMAYAIAVRARHRKLLQGLLLVLVIAPFFTSFILRTIAWKQILADDAPVVHLLKAVHVLPPDGRLTATSFVVVCGLVYNFLPFMVLPIYANLERLDPRMLEAGADLYASPFTTFRKVTFPLSMPGVVSGTLLVFIPASGDYVNSSLLGNPDTVMIGQVVDQRFTKLLDYPTAASLSAILMVIILALVITYVRRSGTEELL